jgi:hypothetical protein
MVNWGGMRTVFWASFEGFRSGNEHVFEAKWET